MEMITETAEINASRKAMDQVAMAITQSIKICCLAVDATWVMKKRITIEVILLSPRNLYHHWHVTVMTRTAQRKIQAGKAIKTVSVTYLDINDGLIAVTNRMPHLKTKKTSILVSRVAIQS